MKLKFWVGTAVSVLVMWLLLRHVDFPRLWEVLRSVNLALLTAGVLLNLVFYYIRSVRWRFLLEPVKPHLPVWNLLSATIIGFMANNVLPAKLGEFVRAWVLARREDLPLSSTVASIVVERLFDTLSILLLVVTVLLFMPAGIGGDISGKIRMFGVFCLVGYICIMSGVFLLMRIPEKFALLASKIGGYASEPLGDKAYGSVMKFAHGLQVIKSPKLLFWILFLSFLHWGLLFMPIWLIMKSCGLTIGIYGALLFLVMSTFGVAVPSTPGNLGAFEVAGVGAMTVLGIDYNTSIGFTLLAHAANFIPVTVIGFLFLYRENLGFKEIKQVEAGV